MQSDESLGVARDDKLLVGGDAEDFHAAVGGGKIDGAADVVLFLVELNAHKAEVGADTGAGEVVVFADAGGKYDGVASAHGGGVGGDELGSVIAEDVESESGALIAFILCVPQVAEVAGNAGDTEHTGLLVENVEHLMDVKVFKTHDIFEERGVDGAGAGSHGDALERSDAHGGIDALAALDGSEGGAVAEVAGHDAELGVVLTSENTRGLCGDVAV